MDPDRQLEMIRSVGDLGRKFLAQSLLMECEYMNHPPHVQTCQRRVSRPYHTIRKDLDSSHQPCGCRSHGR